MPPSKKLFHSPIYTKTGDKGETSLVGGSRVKKNSLRISAYGSVDEANAFVGLSVAALLEHSPVHLSAELRSDVSNTSVQDGSVQKALAENQFKDIIKILEDIQNDLHIIQAQLANPNHVKIGASAQIGEAHTKKLEEICDKYDEKLEPLKRFILSGGSKQGALLHVARTILRRAEREILNLNEKEKVDPDVIKYINRLSDTLFILARTVNATMKVEEKNPRY